jgi:hypothetical protein
VAPNKIERRKHIRELELEAFAFSLQKTRAGRARRKVRKHAKRKQSQRKRKSTLKVFPSIAPATDGVYEWLISSKFFLSY